MTNYSPDKLKLLSIGKKRENDRFFRLLAKKDPGKLDEAFRNLHEAVFSEINCLECANCCKSLGPRITDADVRRISGFLKIRPSELTENHLRIDEDNDYVFRQMPCPFLDNENYCKIYESRPRACRDYPHTNSRRMKQILPITLKNISICPAVFEIVERMKKAEL